MSQNIKLIIIFLCRLTVMNCFIEMIMNYFS